MNKQKVTTHSTSENSRKDTTTQDRYYVQSITEQIFVIREREAVEGEAGSKDRIVKSFDTRHDAYAHLDRLNAQQRKLDTEKREG